jgi:hypothetical protein
LGDLGWPASPPLFRLVASMIAGMTQAGGAATSAIAPVELGMLGLVMARL